MIGMHMIREEPTRKPKEGFSIENSFIPDFTTPKDFIDKKIDILREDFCINLTVEDEDYIRSFKRENEINNAVRAIINKYWK